MNLTLLLLIYLALAPSLVPFRAQASAELDRIYRFQTLSWVKPIDNVQGLLSGTFEDSFQRYFTKKPRFTLRNSARVDEIVRRSKIEPRKILEDDLILKEISRTLDADLILRPKIIKEGRAYRITLDLIFPRRSDLIATESFQLMIDEPSKTWSEIFPDKIEDALDKLFEKLPFMGDVTGREADLLTLSAGRNSGILKGDTVLLGTLENVKKHPLYKSIEGFELNQTGRAYVEASESEIAFARVTEEGKEKGVAQTIAPNQKIIRVIKTPTLMGHQPGMMNPEGYSKASGAISEFYERDMPRLGWVSGGVFVSSESRQHTGTGAADGRSGSSIPIGASMEGALWLNESFLIDGEAQFAFGSYSQGLISSDVETRTGLSSTFSAARLSAGYSFTPNKSLFDPKAWIRMGVRNVSYRHALENSEFLGPTSVLSVSLGIAGELPIGDAYGGSLALDLGVFRGLTQADSTFPPTASVTDVAFSLGGFYRYSPTIHLRATVKAQVLSASYGSGRSLSERWIQFGPSVAFFF